MKLIDEHHLQQRLVLDMITGKEIVGTRTTQRGRSGSAQCLPPDSRVFIDNEVSRPIQYLSWLAVHPNASELVNTSKITKIETLTIGVIVTFVNNESFQRQFTMSKEIPGGMANIVDVRMLPGYNYGFRAEISVYDSGDKASFVLLGDAGVGALNVPEDKFLTYSTITWETIIVTKVVSSALLPPRKMTVDNPSQALDVGHRLSPVSDAANSTVDNKDEE
uniref:Uncharacterized protein n=1 Tax=Brassica oleracea var. oleracea TaxID=109376 RepID=A0A0D3CTZ3_BRAOL